MLCLAGCAAPPPPRSGPSNEEIMARAQARDEESAQKREAAIDARLKAETGETRAERDARRAQEQADDQAARAARAEQERAAERETREQSLTQLAKLQARRDAPPEPDPIREWVDAHCKLEQPPARYVMRCEPVCWQEQIIPCPEYKCSGKPPQSNWVELANKHACRSR
jgi:hypothetical protein